MKSLNSGAALATLVSAAGAVVYALAVDFDKWYDGPAETLLGMLVGVGVMYFKSRGLTKWFADKEGENNVDKY